MNLRLKVALVSICIFLLSLGMVNGMPGDGGEQPLLMAMEATGAQVEEASINSWLKLPHALRNDEELVAIMQQVMREFAIDPLSYQLVEQQKGKQYTIQVEAVQPDFHILVVVKSMPSEGSGAEMDCYLLITIDNMEKSTVSHMERKIRRISEKFGSATHISTCLIGWLNGTLRDGEQQDLLQKAFTVIDGEIIDKLEVEHLVSYTGFTSRIMEWLQVDGRKNNLNMAMRYSQYDNRTYVTIGSPIITREY